MTPKLTQVQAIRKKPEIITFYNNTKGEVDTVDDLNASAFNAQTLCRFDNV